MPQEIPRNHEGSFGRAIETYELEPGLIVMITRDSQGNLLDMVVQGAFAPQPRSDFIHLEKYPIYLNLKEPQLEELIDRLVPSDERGEKSESYGKFKFCADMCISDYSYENVAIYLLWNAQWQDSNEPFSPLRSGPSRLVIQWKRES